MCKALSIDIEELAGKTSNESSYNESDSEMFNLLLLELKEDINLVSYNAWIKELKFVEIKNNILYIETQMPLVFRIVKSHYENMIFEKAKKIFDKKINSVYFFNKN